MGEFLTEFLEALQNRLDDLNEAFLKTRRRSSSMVADWFRRNWRTSLPREINPSRVAAVDASMEMKQYATGVNVIYARALSMMFSPEREGEVIAKRFDIYPHTGAYEDARNLSSRIAEKLEHEAALEAVRKHDGGVLLIDGTLSTRHVASIFNFRRHGWFSVEYIRSYSEMLREAKRAGWTVIALAKSSRSIPMRDLALRDTFTTIVESIPIDPVTKNRLREAWRDAVSDPDEGVRIALSLREKLPDHREELEALAQLFYERHLYVADSDVIRRYVVGAGRTPVILVGAYTQSAQKMIRELDARRGEIAREISSAELARRRLEGEISIEEDLFDEAYRAVGEALDLPAYVTIYVRFRSDDDPLKIEFPCWEVSPEIAWSRLPQVSLLEGSEVIETILGIVKAGYGGPNFHNVWLEMVDRKVKLRKGVVEGIYERYLWRELGEVVLHARGERRITRL